MALNMKIVVASGLVGTAGAGYGMYTLGRSKSAFNSFETPVMATIPVILTGAGLYDLAGRKGGGFAMGATTALVAAELGACTLGNWGGFIAGRIAG